MFIEALNFKGIHVGIEISSVAGSHHFAEYEFAISMVSLIQKIYFLQDVLIDVQYTILSLLKH
jgi:hypothetical protein